MKKHLTILLLATCLVPNLNAQKNDYQWPLGFSPNNSEYRFFYNFNLDTPTITIRQDTFSCASYSASFCNDHGDILLFSNGHYIFNQSGRIVENSDGLNPTIPEWQPDFMFSYPGNGTGFFIQKPDDPNIVYFISLDFGLHPAQEWPYQFVGENLMVATIDLQANGGEGKALEKNKILLTGTLMAPAACKHANGRDWWIMVSNADENIHYSLRLDPEGFSAPDTQYIGSKPNPIPYDGGKSCQITGNCFSPKGNYYVDFNDQLGMSIFSFDRCSGLLTNERRIDYPAPDTFFNTYLFYRYQNGTGGVFSPNERFFYKTNAYAPGPPFIPGQIPHLYQFDLNLPTESLWALRDTINIVDSTDYHFPTNITNDAFYGAEMGPDGRIYVVHEGNSYCTVQYPNEKGRACKFIHDKPYFGVAIGSAIPYMPNYRLGPLDGSPCDTLGINNIPVANFRIDDSLDLLSRYFYDLSHHEPADWHWDFGDGTTSEAPSPLHRYDSAGIYQACLTVSNPYGADTLCRTLYLGVSATNTPTAIKPLVSISPNPFKDQIRIQLHEDLNHPVFRLFDQTGRLLRLEALLSMNVDINSREIPPGIYFWEVTAGGKKAGVGKLVKVE